MGFLGRRSGSTECVSFEKHIFYHRPAYCVVRGGTKLRSGAVNPATTSHRYVGALYLKRGPTLYNCLLGVELLAKNPEYLIIADPVRDCDQTF